MEIRPIAHFGISLVLVLGLLLTVIGSTSALVEQLTLDELTAKADSILVGEVTDITYYQEGEGNIYTLVTLSMDQTIKGETQEEVVIKLPGGEVGRLRLWVSDTPSFKLGEKAVVFLEKEENTFDVCGWYQGKFSVDDDRMVGTDQSLTSFIAAIDQSMETEGVIHKISIEPASEVLESPLKSKAVEPAGIGEFQTGWQNIMTDGFEENFPETTWTLYGTPTWGKESYKPHNGSYSVWCAGSGYDPVGSYPNGMNAWMVYGPFNLTDATDAELNFYRWYETEYGCDYFSYYASIDGSYFYGYRVSGNSGGWTYHSFDITTVPTLGNLCGRSQVWIAFKFDSDGLIGYDGAFVDDVVLRKYVPSAAPHIVNLTPSSGPAGTGFQVTINGTDFGATQNTSTVTFWRVGSTYVGASIVTWSDTQIVCEVPSGASSGLTSHGVRVNTSAGISNDYPFTVNFSYSGNKWFGDNPMGEKIWINPNTNDCTGEWQAVINAMQTWNDVDNANFYFEYGGLTNATNWGYNYHNEIMWVNYDTGSIATCGRWLNSSTGEIIETDIVFNDYYCAWSASGSPSSSQYDVQDIATHELGHCLCLLDLYGTADSEKTMYGYGNTSETKKCTLATEDIAGIQWIYSGTGSRGQYHINVTNNDDDDLTVYFKSDIDNEYDHNLTVLSGQTLTSWWEVVPAGSHQISINWTDSDKGTPDNLSSEWLNVSVEGDTEYSFTIPKFIPTFDTGSGTYPSIAGTHNGTIMSNQDISVTHIYIYPCLGTGGHAESVKIWNSTWNTTATWNDYSGDYHNITFGESFVLRAGETYNYTIITGSYPQIIHATSMEVTGGTITCTEFTDVNGVTYNNWIPAIRLE